VYNLKITALAAQRNTQALIKILLKIPGLKPDEVSKGLKKPPLNVLSTEKEHEAEKLKGVLEKLGAVCAIENTKALNRGVNKRATGPVTAYIRIRHKRRMLYRYNFWIILFFVIGALAFLTYYEDIFGSGSHPHPHPASQPVSQTLQTTAVAQGAKILDNLQTTTLAQGAKILDKIIQPRTSTPANLAKANAELKKDIMRNPYNAEAWKTLSENLEKQGDTASARQAKHSYETALKAQMVLASLAKAFGNRVRVEITEDEVYYRTSYDFTEREFHDAAERLRDSLNLKFPGKHLVIENYTSDNRFQSVRLKSPDKPKPK